MKRATIALTLIFLATPALANAVLPIEGIFGNQSGCEYFMTGERTSDDLLLLTPDTFTVRHTGCYFESLLGSTDHSYAIRALCTREGRQAGARQTVTVFNMDEDGVIVSLVGIRVFGPIRRCPDTDELFQRGVQI